MSRAALYVITVAALPLGWVAFAVFAIVGANVPAAIGLLAGPLVTFGGARLLRT